MTGRTPWTAARSCAAVSRRFTLIEILIVMAIVAVLSAFSLGALRRAVIKAEVARARTQLEAIQAALAMYDSDMRAYPRSQGGTTPEELLRDHGPYLYAGLMNRPTVTLGGGPNAPYVVGKELAVGVVTNRAVLEHYPMGSDGVTSARSLTSEEQARSGLPEFQGAHGPGSAEPLVFLDPWGNPIHCRIWRGTRNGVRDELIRNPLQRTGMDLVEHHSGDAPVPGPIADRPHDPVGIDIWSNGPNGINEYGGGDDVRTWVAQ